MPTAISTAFDAKSLEEFVSLKWDDELSRDGRVHSYPM